MSRPRDFQRQRCYNAEHAYIASHGAGRRFTTVGECSAYANIVRHEFGRMPVPDSLNLIRVHVYDGRGRRTACGFPQPLGSGFNAIGVLNLPKWARSELVILHELAHAYSPIDEPAHGPRWARRFLTLVYAQLGAQEAVRLGIAFRTFGVQVEVLE